MNVLHLHVRSKYFDEIANGKKLYEYRLHNSFWTTRLLLSDYTGIVIYKGYPKKTDYNSSNRIERIWRGWKTAKIIHSEFGNKPITVFAIRVNP